MEEDVPVATAIQNKTPATEAQVETNMLEKERRRRRRSSRVSTAFRGTQALG